MHTRHVVSRRLIIRREYTQLATEHPSLSVSFLRRVILLKFQQLLLLLLRLFLDLFVELSISGLLEDYYLFSRIYLNEATIDRSLFNNSKSSRTSQRCNLLPLNRQIDRDIRVFQVFIIQVNCEIA